MVPDCIDPKAGGFLREIMEESASGTVAYNWNDLGDLWEVRLHGRGCPSCRTEFVDLLPVFKRIGVGLASKFRDVLSDLRNQFLLQRNARLAEAHNPVSAYAEIIVWWALAEEDVFHFVIHGQEALGFVRSATAQRESDLASGARMPSLSNCRDFISSLEPEDQLFVFSVAFAHDLFMPVFERIRSESAEKGPFNYVENLQDSMHAGIARSELDPATLFSIIEKGAIACSTSSMGWPKGGEAGIQELRTALEDVGDSLKAGQMELGRQLKQLRRPPAAYESTISARLGEPLYSRLHSATQRRLQWAEYMYNLDLEPDGFCQPASDMARGYENELLLRIIWPFLEALRASGTQSYGDQGRELLRWGKEHKRGMTLGSFAWFLKNKADMRSWACERGFDVEAIWTDADWVNYVRNEAVHNLGFDRTLADELHRRIMRRDGILSRLHPTVRPTDGGPGAEG